MRPFGSLIEKTAKFREPMIPGARLERVNPPVTRHLEEGIVDLFNYACGMNELESAADLVVLLEKWHARRPYANEQQRRTGGIHVIRMRGELERRHIARGTRYRVG